MKPTSRETDSYQRRRSCRRATEADETQNRQSALTSKTFQWEKTLQIFTCLRIFKNLKNIKCIKLQFFKLPFRGTHLWGPSQSYSRREIVARTRRTEQCTCCPCRGQDLWCLICPYIQGELDAWLWNKWTISRTYRKVKVTQLCPTLCDPVVCSLPSSTSYGILQARVLEWVAISFSRT